MEVLRKIVAMLYCAENSNKNRVYTCPARYSFLKTIFDLHLVESVGAEPEVLRGQLCVQTIITKYFSIILPLSSLQINLCEQTSKKGETNGRSVVSTWVLFPGECRTPLTSMSQALYSVLSGV